MDPNEEETPRRHGIRESKDQLLSPPGAEASRSKAEKHVGPRQPGDPPAPSWWPELQEIARLSAPATVQVSQKPAPGILGTGGSDYETAGKASRTFAQNRCCKVLYADSC